MNLSHHIVGSLCLSILCASAAFAQPVLPPVMNAIKNETGSAVAQVSAAPQGQVKASQPQAPAASFNPFVTTSVAPKVYSYGTSDLSLLFLPSQVSRMKEAIGAFEDQGSNFKLPLFAQPEQPVAAKAEAIMVEPPMYPVFFLSSIVYNGPKDWAIWMGGEKITSRHNETEVTVLNVSPDSATFLWKPTYVDAIEQRKLQEAFAVTDAVKNKLSTQQKVSLNEEKGEVTFTLKQNQSFAVAYFNIFEGYVDSPQLAPIKVSAEDKGVPLSMQDSLSSVNDPKRSDGVAAVPAAPSPM